MPFSIGRANYESLQVKVEKQLSQGYTFLASYTWSKNIDLACSGAINEGCDFPQIYNLKAGRSVAAIDAPQILALSSVAELPFGKAKPFLNSGAVLPPLLGNWQANFIVYPRSGAPYSMQSGTDIANIGTPNGQKPNLIGDPNAVNWSLKNAFNKDAFAFPALCTYGNVGRNTMRTTPYRDFDFSLFRNIPIHESHRLQFRAEFFNILNHPNFGAPNSTMNSPAYGTIGSATAHRIVQFALKYMF